jgi:hypothetical protein
MRLRIEKLPRYRELERFVDPNGTCAHVAAEALCETVRAHLIRAADSRHKTADKWGAPETNHLTRGARLVVADRNAVVIPIPGITRAFGDLTIRPKNAKALTIPVHAAAYGVRASRLAAEGWTLFSRRGILFGKQEGDPSPVALYLLRSSAKIPEDPGLLPDDEAMGTAIRYGVTKELERLRRVA